MEGQDIKRSCFDNVDSMLMMWTIREFGVKSIGHFHLPNTSDYVYSLW